jgi:flagellum-specific peptidoglycan hydrolase FlgJ
MDDRQQQLNQVARIAVALEVQTGCPAPLMIAQWAVESRWGAKPVGHANYLGIKKSTRHTLCCKVATHEFSDGQSVAVEQEFADYGSLAECCQDYVWLITQAAPYMAAWRQYQANHDLHALIVAVAAKYSTSPQYAALVTAVARQGNVDQAIAAARQEASRAG